MRIYKGLSVLAGIAALSLAAVAPASADSYRSQSNYSRARRSRASGSTDYAAHTRDDRAGSSPATYNRYRYDR